MMCVCKFAPDGTPDGLCKYHEKWAKAMATHSRDATLKQINDFLETRGVAMKMRGQSDDGLLLLAIAKEFQERRSPIRVGLLKLEDPRDLKR